MILESFFFIALVGGCLIASISAPFGCLMIWKRFANFSDALAHASILGVVLSLWKSLPLLPTLLVTSLCFAYSLYRLKRSSWYGADTLITLMGQGGFAIGMLVLTTLPLIRVDLMSLLLGDILALTLTDIAIITVISLCAFIWLIFRLKPLLLATVCEELAYSEGIAVKRMHGEFVTMLGLLIAIIIHMIGILLVTALLIMPAVAARPWASDPAHMMRFASMIGCLSVLCGLYGSYVADTPTGPSIVLVLLAAVGLSFGLHTFKQHLTLRSN